MSPYHPTEQREFISGLILSHEVIHIRDEIFKKGLATERHLVKDRESRIVPIHPDLQSYLTGCGKTSGYFLTGDQGRKLSYDHALDMFVNKIIKPLQEEFPAPENELGFKDGRYHSFRHFFVSECFDAGIPESDIKNLGRTLRLKGREALPAH